MNLKKILLLAACFAAGSPVFAQYASDAVRFSQYQQGASARFKAMGGAQTAVGGDIGSLASNPAGLGLFTKSEFNFSADFSNWQVESRYIGQDIDAKKDRLGIDQIGGVIYNPTLRAKGDDLKTGWLSVNYGVSYNKTNNFNNTIDYSGTNPNSSIADYFSDLASFYLAQGDPANNSNALPANSLESMAYKNFLIEFDPDGYFPTTSLDNNQRNLVYRTGSQSEVNFGAGANYSNKLYVGGSFAITSLNYNADRQFTEDGSNRTYVGQPVDFVGGSYEITYKNDQVTTGTGFNGKIGMIYRATDAVRVGLSFISPTWIKVSDSFSESLDTRYTKATGGAIPPYTNSPQIYDTDYTLRTPYRVNGGLSAIISQQGLLSADVEYVDYSSINFSIGDRIAEQNTNDDIRDRYQAAVNFRLGGEYKVNNLMLRAGYNRTGSPFKDIEISSDILSGGIGFRSSLLYVDLTYQNATFNTTSSLTLFQRIMRIIMSPVQEKRLH
jgi:long-subunit fatty acid transport protein